MKPVYQTLFSIVFGIIVWFIADELFGVYLRSQCPHESPCSCGMLTYILIGLPIAFFSAGVSTGILMPGHRRFLIILLVILTGLCICLCTFLAVFDPDNEVALFVVYGTLVVLGVVLGYSLRRLLIPRLFNRPGNEKDNAEQNG